MSEALLTLKVRQLLCRGKDSLVSATSFDISLAAKLRGTQTWSSGQ